MSFYDWLIGNGGTGGEYQYQKIHIVTTIIVFLFVVLFSSLALNKNISSKTKRKILVSVAIFQLSFELIWRLMYFFIRQETLVSLWPMYPCNLGGIIVPIFALTNFKVGKKMFYLFGFIGGCLTFALPEGIFTNNILVFPILKSILQHTGLLIIPTFEYFSKTYKTSIKDYGFIVLGVLVHLLNCEVIDRILGFTGDYMFLRGDMPFVIPQVPQFITMFVFGAIVFFILSFFLGFNESLSCFKQKRIKLVELYK